MLAGVGDADDLAAVLAYFAENPWVLASKSAVSSSTERSKGQGAGASGLVDLAAMAPVDALATRPVPQASGNGASAFERLLTNLRRYFDVRGNASAVPLLSTHDAGQRDDNSDLPPPPPMPNCYAEKALSALLDRARHVGSSEREAVRCIPGFIRAVSPHLQEPTDFVERGIRRWLEVALTVSRAAGPDDDPDNLDRTFAAVVTARVIARHLSPMGAHELLQKWGGGAHSAEVGR